MRLVLKGGGCENVGAQYSLPAEKLNANRDLDGCRNPRTRLLIPQNGRRYAPGNHLEAYRIGCAAANDR